MESNLIFLLTISEEPEKFTHLVIAISFEQAESILIDTLRKTSYSDFSEERWEEETIGILANTSIESFVLPSPLPIGYLEPNVE